MPAEPNETRYQTIEPIAPFAAIFTKAEDTQTGQVVVLKKLRMGFDEGVSAEALREISIMKELQHEHVVGVLDVFFDPEDKVYLVLELMDQDLSSLMRSRVNGLSGIVLRSYLHQMLDALSYCHGHRVLHRDLKPRHVLVSRDMQTVKLSGFSLSRCFSLPLHTYTHEVVTLWYRAPEVLLGDMHYGPALDVWSLGCIFAEMATKRVLFPGDSEIDELFKIFRLLGTPDERNWPGVAALPDWSDVFPPWRPQPLGTALGPALDSEALDLLAKMLRHDPSERIPAKAALQHPYFASLEAQEA